LGVGPAVAPAAVACAGVAAPAEGRRCRNLAAARLGRVRARLLLPLAWQAECLRAAGIAGGSPSSGPLARGASAAAGHSSGCTRRRGGNGARRRRGACLGARDFTAPCGRAGGLVGLRSTERRPRHDLARHRACACRPAHRRTGGAHAPHRGGLADLRLVGRTAHECVALGKPPHGACRAGAACRERARTCGMEGADAPACRSAGGPFRLSPRLGGGSARCGCVAGTEGEPAPADIRGADAALPGRAGRGAARSASPARMAFGLARSAYRRLPGAPAALRAALRSSDRRTARGG